MLDGEKVAASNFRWHRHSASSTRNRPAPRIATIKIIAPRIDVNEINRIRGAEIGCIKVRLPPNFSRPWRRSQRRLNVDSRPSGVRKKRAVAGGLTNVTNRGLCFRSRSLRYGKRAPGAAIAWPRDDRGQFEPARPQLRDRPPRLRMGGPLIEALRSPPILLGAPRRRPRQPAEAATPQIISFAATPAPVLRPLVWVNAP